MLPTRIKVMTAIVGIINRKGAAFAADSAATHTLSDDKKKKITNQYLKNLYSNKTLLG